MNHRYATLAASALAMGAVTLVALEASADVTDPTYGYTVSPAQTTAPPWPDEGTGYPLPEPSGYDYPEYKLDDHAAPAMAPRRSEVPVDDDLVEALQSAASALGGAGLALGGLWLYRRRHVPVR